MRKRLPIRGILYLIVGLVLYGINEYRNGGPSLSNPSIEAPAGSGVEAIAEAFRNQRSGLVVETEGVVSRKLADDLEGSRHQKFILRLSDGHTILVSHNIDLSTRIPISKGDRVELRGQYEWGERGGVIHWTHHDPQGRRPGGWIRHQNQIYR